MFVSATGIQRKSTGMAVQRVATCRRAGARARSPLRAAAAGAEPQGSAPRKPTTEGKTPKKTPSLSAEERAARVQQLKLRILLVHRQLQVAESKERDDSLSMWRSFAHDMATPEVNREQVGSTNSKNIETMSADALRKELDALKAEIASLDADAYADVLRNTDGIKTAEQRIKEHEHKIQQAPKVSFQKVVAQDTDETPKQKPKPKRFQLFEGLKSWFVRNEPIIEELEREIESI
jgi:ribosomal protein L29